MSQSPAPDTLTANAELLIGGKKLNLKMVVPAGEVPPESLLPTLQVLSSHIVDGLEQKVQRQGAEISCKKGCGACCRQHVPISPAEARLMAAIVENMEEPGRSQTIARFEQAVRRLRESGILEQAMNYHQLSEEATGAMVREYFKLGIACPFLQDESCSIHEFRPLICREYLVISSPDHCASLNEAEIKRLQLPVSVAETFSEMEGVAKDGENPYMPLIMALEWSDEHGDECEFRPGPRWVQAFFEGLTGKQLPDPASDGDQTR